MFAKLPELQSLSLVGKETPPDVGSGAEKGNLRLTPGENLAMPEATSIFAESLARWQVWRCTHERKGSGGRVLVGFPPAAERLSLFTVS
jgi:hypothetical protein